MILYVEPLGVEGGMGGYNDALVSAYVGADVPVHVITSTASALLQSAAKVTISEFFRASLIDHNLELSEQFSTCLDTYSRCGT